MADVTHHPAKLAMPLAGFFSFFFVAPVALLLLVSFFATPEMDRFGLDQ